MHGVDCCWECCWYGQVFSHSWDRISLLTVPIPLAREWPWAGLTGSWSWPTVSGLSCSLNAQRPCQIKAQWKQHSFIAINHLNAPASSTSGCTPQSVRSLVERYSSMSQSQAIAQLSQTNASDPLYRKLQRVFLALSVL